MGTRHLIAVHLDGKYPVAQYGQWDGYPESQGASILDFLNRADLEVFKAKCRAARFSTKEECDALGATWKQTHPWLSRDAGSDVLDFVLDQPEGIMLTNQLPFAGNSLFCEWAYVIDLDAGILEVFKGFNEEPLPDTDRFAKMEGLEKTDGYYPVRSVARWPLSKLPTEEAFIKELVGEDEEVNA